MRDSPDDTKDAFYFELKRILDSVPGRDILFVTGDFNARMGKPDANPERVIERHTVGHRCPNGERMLQLAKYINLCLVNT